MREGIDKDYTDKKRIELYPFFEKLRSSNRYSELMIKMETKIDSFKNEVELKYPEFFECR